jgi:hypothetical protein
MNDAYEKIAFLFHPTLFIPNGFDDSDPPFIAMNEISIVNRKCLFIIHTLSYHSINPLGLDVSSRELKSHSKLRMNH